MSYGYPDGCTQADHDRAFGELSTEPDDDVVRLDCGHYDTELRGEEVGGKLVCPKCFDERQKLIRDLVTNGEYIGHAETAVIQSEIPHASDCNVWVGEECDCITGKP